MSNNSKYSDIHSELFRARFESALPFDEYVATGDSTQQSKWLGFAEKIELNPTQRELLGGFKRKINLLVLSGIWCGDCARQGPMLNAIASATDCVDLRFAENSRDDELVAELKINGAKKVPVALCLSEDYFEVARFGDAHLSVYRRKAKNQLGAACDPGILPPPDDELAEELNEWVNFIERAHLVLRLAPMLRQRYND